MGNEKQIIKILNQEGQVVDAHVLLSFTLNTDKKDYIIYTTEKELDTTDEYATIEICLVKKDENGKITFTAVEDPQSLEEIKNIMREIILN